MRQFFKYISKLLDLKFISYKNENVNLFLKNFFKTCRASRFNEDFKKKIIKKIFDLQNLKRAKKRMFALIILFVQ